MAAPVTTDQLITLIEKSNLIPPDRLDEVVKKYRASGGSEDVQEMMGQLVKTGILTHFQSQQLIQGKWRGFSIGKYKVLERLGSGGMGSVYLCEHLSMHSKVAIKVLPTAKNNDPAALGRFYREARAAGALAHPNLVKADEIDQDGELHFLVMDFVEGVNLQQLVHRNGKGLSALRSCH